MQKRFYIPASSSSHTSLHTTHHQPPKVLLASWDSSDGGPSIEARAGEEEEDEEVPASLFLQHVSLLQAEDGRGFRSEFRRIEGEGLFK
jgi:hypothetical protein